MPARRADASCSAAEGAAAFDDLTRSGRDGQMVLQNRSAWPNSFRSARFIPAVESLQAQRVRSLLIEQMDAQLKGFDCYIAPSFSANLVLTNLTGQPAVAVPNGFTAAGLPPPSPSWGQLYDEGTLLALARLTRTLLISTKSTRQCPRLRACSHCSHGRYG